MVFVGRFFEVSGRPRVSTRRCHATSSVMPSRSQIGAHPNSNEKRDPELLVKRPSASFQVGEVLKQGENQTNKAGLLALERRQGLLVEANVAHMFSLTCAQWGVVAVTSPFTPISFTGVPGTTFSNAAKPLPRAVWSAITKQMHFPGTRFGVILRL